MANRSIPIGESLRFGWETFRANAFFLVGVFVAISAVNGILEYIAERDTVANPLAEFLFTIAVVAVKFLLEIGVIVIALKFVDGKRPEFGDLFNRVHLLLNYTGAALLYFLMIIVGLVFFVFPGIYLAVRFYFFGYFVVDRGATPIDALKMSSDLTEGIRMELFTFGLLVLMLLIAGLCAFLVGVFVALPVTSLAMGFVFRYLQSPPPGRETEVLTRAA
ncbi:MAG: hypothetical protein ACE5EO_11560 [Candidatus Krumholzibacteriia bacterium]